MKILTIAAVFIMFTACTKKEVSNPPKNENGTFGPLKRCWENETQVIDSTGKVIIYTRFYYTNGLIDSSIRTNLNNPELNYVIRYTYTSKYERKQDVYVDGIVGTSYLEKLNESGMVIESRILRLGSLNERTVMTYYCN